ncbi:MAG: thymidylate synthase [Candidatus Eisenbacteria bacterium]|nr:thymidylate synthase [Candidatus Eisenbacteria bacterium]
MRREAFTEEERRRLQPYFTNTDRPVFALTNLPEVVKGALFARYSRSDKSLRRLFLAEFLDGGGTASGSPEAGLSRAEGLYEKIFSQYGDDSVAQLGGAHLAVEGASNILTKVLERGRLMAYLEQSTRYVPYTRKLGGRWRYGVPPEVAGSGLADAYRRTLDAAFETYARWLEPLQQHLERTLPKGAEPPAVRRRTLRAKALDALRGLLPAATLSNVGLYGSGQSYENLLLRMRAHELGEAQDCAAAMLRELRRVIPAFLKRVDLEERGVRWSRYLKETRAASHTVAAELCPPAGSSPGEPPSTVTLTDFDPEGELKVAAAVLYESTGLSDPQALDRARRLSSSERGRLLAAYVGERANRRHKPGRAFERTSYRFDILSDYGAFRDLQRHRILSIEWQRLGARHGYVIPPEITTAGAERDWRAVMETCAELHAALLRRGPEAAAAYAIPMAYRIRYVMQMNAREAMHLLELRSSSQGHPSYRRIAQEMHRLIAAEAGHRELAGAMRFVDHSTAEEGRLQAELRTARKRPGQE